MTTALVTGFEPFAGDACNPSAEAVHLLAESWIDAERSASLIAAHIARR